MKLVMLDYFPLNPGDLSFEGFSRLCGVDSFCAYERSSYNEAIERIGDSELIIPNKVRIDEELLTLCPNIKYIGLTSTGYDVVDLSATAKRGIVVTNVPEYGSASVAEHIFALILELTRFSGLHSQAVKQGEWERCPDYTFHKRPLIELCGKTIGFIGMGKIGLRAARIALAFGMRVLCHHSKNELCGVEKVSLDTLLEQSDIVCLCCPLNESTIGLINEDTLAKFKRGAILINTARGGLLDEDAVFRALCSGRLYGVGMDVTITEPPQKASPLFSHPNVIITPHIAWAPLEARQRLLDAAIDNLSSFLKGEPKNVIR